MEKLESAFAKGQQGWTYEAFWKLGSYKLRVDIYVDSYPFQSHARCHIFSKDERRWNVLVTLPHSLMSSIKVFAHSAYLKDEDKAKFFEDEAELTRKALMVLA